ncbi:PCI domain-containing protein [Mycena chlorophos]|uniref:COP9 signalosome complex subunit 3 n=1 Tax=Mycena chlorophos TaxID=658473 RepID=A0A8H6W1S5_MYCCL|nr:PCI domain-containing protein [Mycena chlorophos]
MAPDMSLDRILQEITTTTNVAALNQTLKNSLPKESRDTILSSALASGQDPLSILDARQNTLGALYILSARLNTPNAAVPPEFIKLFCARFLPEQARLAPERVTLLAKGIVKYAVSNGVLSWAIGPLLDLLMRYPPDTSYLTTIHTIFLNTCVVAQQPSAALPVLANPIANVVPALSDITYNDNLMYHYLGGMALAMLKRWPEAEEFFEICVTAPGAVPAALQLEALKKLRLVQLISRGETTSLPKYAHAGLPRIFKNTPYSDLVSLYPQNIDKISALVEKEKQLFGTEKNLGLIMQAIDRAPRWTLRKLTATYVALGLADIARLVGIPSEDEVRALLLSMIEAGDISAQISASGTVTFSDPPPQFTREEVDAVLRSAQTQSALLEGLDLDMARSREFISKAVKGQDGASMWGPGQEEELYAMSGGAGAWAEEAMFA